MEQIKEGFKNATIGGATARYKHKFSMNVAYLLSEAELEPSLTTSVYCSMMIVAQEIKPMFTVGCMDDGSTWDDLCAEQFSGDALDASMGGDYQELIEFIDTNHTNAKGWLLELTACWQTSPLKARNIESYFSQFDGMRINGGRIMPLVAHFSVNVPSVMNDEELRGLMSDTKFMQYHTQLSSTPTLMLKAFAVLGKFAGHVFPQGIIEIANVAAAAPWDAELLHQIPEKWIMVTHACLKANNLLPTEWYQGIRAVESCSAAEYTTYLNLFVHAARTSSDTAGLADATSVETVFARAAASLEGEHAGDVSESKADADEKLVSTVKDAVRRANKIHDTIAEIISDQVKREKKVAESEHEGGYAELLTAALGGTQEGADLVERLLAAKDG
jgi:hypothetical protein